MQPGTRLAHYEIVSALGKGGMGEVWRARDTKLGREVAIKTLPEAFARDADRLARFEREAKLLATLNHPNIAAIYGLEEHDGMRFLVLELVEGETLADHIERGAIPVEESLKLALQIAEALEAAHEKGVVHRDLKPANIKVTPDGKVKVLDFGLAKTWAGAPAVNMSQSPTISMAATQQGVILGTAAYMSPEQARGGEVDKRTDVWAFGCVLFEMLTGKVAFAAGNVTDTLAAVVRGEPHWTQLPGNLNPRLRETLSRCLEKDRHARWHDIGDVRVDIERVRAHAEAPMAQDLTAPRSSRTLAWGLTLLAGMLLTALTTWYLLSGSATEVRTVRFSFPVPSGANQGIYSNVAGRVAISRDGQRIAYLATRTAGDADAPGEPIRQIMVRAMSDAAGTPLPGTEDAQALFFSYDGAWVGFVAKGQLWKAPADGTQTPLPITPIQEVAGADWGADNTIILGSGINGGLMQVSANGDTKTLTSLDPAKGEILHGYPEILPDAHTVLFTIGTQNGSRIARLSLDTGDWEDLSWPGSTPRYVDSGYVVFSQNGNLRMVPFDLKSRQPSGPIQPVQDGIDAGSWAGLESVSFDLSEKGDLVFVLGSIGFRTEPVWVDSLGKETPIAAPAGMYIGPRVSPDGRRIATIRTDAQGIGEVWVMNRDGSQAFPVAADGADYNPVWTPDGKTLTYTSNGDIFERPVDEPAEERTPLLPNRPNYQLPRSWSADGATLAFREASTQGARLWVMSRDGEPEPLTSASFNAGSPRFHPQEGWIAYQSDETGQFEIYVRRYPGSQRPEQVSRGGGREPAWSPDGRQLYYRSGNRMMAVTIQIEPEFKTTEPVELWTHPYFAQTIIFQNYDVAPDGRFLMLAIPDVSEKETVTVTVVLDWLAELQQRMVRNP